MKRSVVGAVKFEEGNLHTVVQDIFPGNAMLAL